ncbi:formate dehydrogenase-O [Escherichia coli]|uniref:Formate dehydrogenase-O n=1 Tax=Escherichia coli TaxID=562 RepID=A0A377BPM7_ECOLX|nr:formate dehydrogenase-O [Escherichia coli]
MAYQSQDIIRRSATNGLTPAPQARDFQEKWRTHRRYHLYRL